MEENNIEKDDKEEEVKIENLCPMIAMISSGKTRLLKVLYDIDYLEVKASSGISTKIVTIIKYNSKIGANPKLYHLKLKNKGIEDYSFFKDANEKVVIGKNDIQKRVNELNEELKIKERPYKELFYLLEVGTTFIKDKEYLKKYDLVDVPGLSEYKQQENTPTPKNTPEDNISLKPNENEDLGPPEICGKEYNKDQLMVKTVEQELENWNIEDEKNYLTEIFKIIKSKMNNGIFVFNIENYQLKDNYLIIGKLQKIINKPIENFLFIFNKIDKSEDVLYDINTLGCKFMEYFPNAEIFNFTKNQIIPCSAIQLENELKMHNSFIHLFFYHFINFLMNNKVNMHKTEITPTINNITFIDYLKKLYNNLHKNQKKKDFYNSIKKVINDRNTFKEIKNAIEIISDYDRDNNAIIDIKIDDFDESEINKIEESMNEEEEEEEENCLDANEHYNSMIILYFYYEFLYKKELLPSKSQDTRDIINFFSLNNIEKKNYIEKEVLNEIKIKKEEENTYNMKIDELSNRLYKFYRTYERENEYNDNSNILGQYINSLIGFLKNTKALYIPLLGVSNAGKSTILNSIIGNSILPSKRNECTKKGILIRYWDKDYPIIRKTRFVKKELYAQSNIYYFISEEKIIAQGERDIYKILEGANGKFCSDEKDFFYEINIKIKLIDELKIDNRLKEKICFIDLPGFGTNNAFENNDTYSHLMQSCNIFLFVVFNLKLTENDNHKMLINLKKTAEKKGIPTNAFINKCLFIINCDKSQPINNNTESEAKRDILKVIDYSNNNNKNINESLSVCFLNSKYYEDYNFKLRYYNNLDFLFDYEYAAYLRSKENFWKGKLDKLKGKTFLKYILTRLKESIRNDINLKFNEKDVIIAPDVSNKIKEIISNKFAEGDDKINIEKNKKDIEQIELYLTFAKNNIKNCDLINKSNIDSFITNLVQFIYKINEKEEEEINQNLILILNKLDFVFQVSPDTKFGKFRDIPIFKKFDSSINDELKKFKEDVKNILKLMENDYEK